MFKIGNITVPNRVVLASTVRIAFCLTVKEIGAGLFTAEGNVNKNEKTTNMLYIDEKEMPMGLRTFGGEEAFLEATQFVEQNTNAHIIDINMGVVLARKLRNSIQGHVGLLEDSLTNVKRERSGLFLYTYIYK